MRGSARRLCVALTGVLLWSLAVPPHALADMGPGPAASAPQRSRPCAAPVLDDPAGGASAVRELGSDLPAAAADVGKTPAEYRELLKTDPTVRVDECDVTFVVEPDHTAGDALAESESESEAEAEAGGDAGDSSPGAAAVTGGLDASGDAFSLNSRPGSQRTIYLDFDGERIVDTAWNTSAGNPDFFATPFDVDGSPTSFGPAEQDVVRGAWQRVAEDYAPFDVNVTTQDPGPDAITRTGITDAVYGTRALVTSDDVVFTNVCDRHCAGIAYMNAFDRTSRHAWTQPALIFQQGLVPTAKSIAEAASHEVGHNLGLSHDGTSTLDYYSGHGSWAPIMGVGYYLPVSQWSNGEYGGNNPEDDLAVIQENGLRVLANDHTDGPSGATALSYAAGAADGLIATRDDVDWFSFTVPTGAASTTVRVTPQATGGNLDTRLDLYDVAGAPLAAAYPPVSTLSRDLASGLDSSVSQSLPAGTYFAKVDGVGSGDSPSTGYTGYTDYASLGRYTVSVGGSSAGLSVTTPSLPRATVGEPYSASLDAVGGTAPYTWSLVSGPAWAHLSGAGVLSGTPSDAGAYPVTARVVDAVGRSATTMLTLSVASTPVTETPVTPTGPAYDPPTPPIVAVRPVPAVYRGALRKAVSDLKVRAERRAGFSPAQFPMVDANRDCQTTRDEVLLAESRSSTRFSSSRRCTVRTGKWFSFFDRTYVKAASRVTTVSTVPLAEGWASGARAWSADRRRAYANDLGDARTIVAVSKKSAKARGSKEPTRWLPARASRCQYVAQWVAVKIRWGLTVDAAEQRGLTTLAAGCTNVRLSVRRA